MTTETRPDLRSMATAAAPDRNRAVDAYRAAAMLAVAVGHWAAIAVATDDEGRIVGSNALSDAPGLAWLSWVFQVMPLFFVVGGFSSAMSLDAHSRSNGRSADWVAARLRRMLAPTVVLGGTWLVLVAVAVPSGALGIVGPAAVAAAIPLWFLANYTIDTAIAPWVLPTFRRHPGLVAGGGVALFGAIEAVRMAGVPVVPQLNWVLGWLLFQVAGFAWRDGLLPTGRHLASIAAALWAAAGLAVTVGPWPVAMVHHEGLTNSPTHPPSLALMLFGAAYSTTAIVLAPVVSRALRRSPRAWAAVVAGNAVSLTVYLWHFSAFIVAAALFNAVDLLPTAEVASARWWLQKVPMTLVAAGVLAVITVLLSGVERRALLAPRQPWRGGNGSMFVVAMAVSASLKLWVGGTVPAAIVGSSLLLVIWCAALRRPGRASEVEVRQPRTGFLERA